MAQRLDSLDWLESKQKSNINIHKREHADVRAIVKDNLTLSDPIAVTNKLCTFLKSVHNVDMIIALTHMRVPEEARLIELCPDVDLFLGGHDHDYLVMGEYTANKNVYSGNIRLLKSGSDFEQFSVINFHSRDQVVGNISPISPFIYSHAS